MAEMKPKSGKAGIPPYISRLRRELQGQLAHVGIDNAKVEAEPISGTKLVRFRVVANRFSKLKHSERQELVWRIVDQTLDKNQQLFISTIQTLTPSEASGQSAA